MTGKLNVVVAGAGRVGFETVQRLRGYGHDLTVVESDGDRCDAIADEYVATVIRGDASDPDVLEQAGVGDADAVAALTGDSGVNLAVCVIAREMNPEVRTVARIDSPSQERYGEFVDAVVFPELSGGRAAANEVLAGGVETLADVTGELDIMEIEVAEGAPAAGRTLSAVRFPAGTLVISGEDGGQIARPETTLTPGRRYIVAAESEVADEVVHLLRG
ncbi:TrkA family potassium uptake protein [Halobaculum sp. MBLA0143]|uniref:potassium channel family protein n=1 Tax=Halobaculum sp. MBLA0143 TaxID=3079933 RepID=UPI003525608B